MPLQTIQYTGPWSSYDNGATSYADHVGVVWEALSKAGVGGVLIPVMAHLQLETGNFYNFVAPWNYGNIKYFGQSTKGTFLVQYNDDNPNDKFIGYASPQDGLSEYVKLITGKFQIKGTENATDFASKLKAKGYATDPNFVNKVAQKAQEIEFQHPELLTWGNNGTTPTTAGGRNVVVWLLLASLVLGKLFKKTP